MYEKNVQLLNKALADEFSAVHQYLYFHFHCKDQGMDLLAGLFMKTAMAEMHHVDKLSERILFLKGDINMNISSEVKKIKSVIEMLEHGKKMEQQSVVDYNHWANECSSFSDAVSRQIFEGLVAEEEKHFEQFDIEIGNIKKFGDSYLSLQSVERTKSMMK